jgi:type 2 lantibiotic biosynthesis protein LanM
MHISNSILIKIIEQSKTLSEILSSNLVFNESEENNILVDAKIDEWCQVAAMGNWKQFEKRLAWDDLDLNKIRKVLRCICINDYKEIPAWTEILSECLNASTSLDCQTLEVGNSTGLLTNRYLDTLNPLPFEDVLSPFICVAIKRVKNLIGSSYNLLSEDAHANLERTLLRWLSRLSSLCLELDFSIFRAARQPKITHLLRQSNKNCSQKYYLEFVNSLFTGGLLKFFQEYPMLARLMAMAIDMWVDATQEFILRLESDKLEIQQIFQNGTETGQVITIKTQLSDRHNNGRSVIVLTFDSGLKLVYKPRNLEIEQVYVNLLGWFNEHDISLKFKLFKVFNRSKYGWVEFVETTPCKDQEETRRYYQRMGILLSLTYILEGTDLHYENVIACGEHPVLIDLETLIHPRANEVHHPQNSRDSKFFANQKLANSVIRTGLLPHWQIIAEGVAQDVSALGADQEETLVEVQRWLNINTDSMAVDYEKVNIQPSANTPSIEGVNRLNDYHQEIIDGFQQMYQFIMEHRQEILGSDSPLAVLAGQEVRFIFRSTQTYGYTFFRTLTPKFLRNGVDWSIQLDLLSMPLLSSDTKPFYWPLLSIEKQMLEKMDIPLFTAHSDSDDLKIDSNQTIEKYFREPSFNSVVSRLMRLNNEDLEQQTSFIRSALYSSIANNLHVFPLSNSWSIAFDTITPLTQLKIIQEAIAIAKNLNRKAILALDGSATWIAPQYMIDTHKYMLSPVNYSLFDGSSGVVLFLAALEKVTGCAEFNELTFAALQPLLQNLQKKTFKEDFSKKYVGGSVGFGSIIYVLSHVSQLLNKPSLIDTAKQLAFLITPDLITSDERFDIFSGSAGTILGLLALYRISDHSDILSKAIICGHHLLNNRIINEGYRVWKTLDDQSLLGFLNGISGITYTLFRLYQASGQIIFLEAAQESLAYERNVISEKNNWLSCKKNTKKYPAHMAFGFYSVHGIALARVAELSILGRPEIDQDIETIIKSINPQKLLDIDNLQDGNLGLVEFLLYTGRKLEQPELVETAMILSNQVIARANQQGNFAYSLPLTFHPGFFQGASGIGYELLRLVYPHILPSVLLWD